MFTNTPPTPYYAVIFTSMLSDNTEGYKEMAEKMIILAGKQDGFIGMDSSRSEIGITVSYWKDMESIQKWSKVREHEIAKSAGKLRWYKEYKSRISKLVKEY